MSDHQFMTSSSTWVMQQYNDLKHTSKLTSEWLKRIQVSECPSQSPNLNLMPWHDLKQAAHTQKPSDVAELKQLCKEEWARIPSQQCERVIASYRKCLATVGIGTSSVFV